MSLAAIVRALGGELHAGGRRANVPGPGHSAADRSVSLLLEGDRVIAHSFAGDDWREVLGDLARRGLVDAEGRLGHGGGVPTGGPPPPGRTARLAAARALWDEARPIEGSLADRHCRRRGIVGPLPEALRHHPSVPSAVYRGAGIRRPALVAAIRDAEGCLCGVEVTYLAPNGDRAVVPTPRKTIGGCPAGAAVCLAHPGPALLVGEGVFTTLSAAAVFRLPAYALLSTRNLERWRPPKEVEAVLIAADRGPPGERAARRLAGALRADGVRTRIEWPPPPWSDWNDAAVGGGLEEEGGREVTGAAGGWSGPPARRATHDQDP